MLFVLLDAAINFYSGLSGFIKKSYSDLKTRTFEHKLLYYAIYDTNKKRYTLVYDYDNPLCVLSYLVFGAWLVTPIGYEDLENVLHADNIAVVCSYILYGEQRSDVYDYASYKAPRRGNSTKVIFAYSDTNEDLTHEFEKFKNTIFDIQGRFGAQHVFNMLVGYKKKTPETIDHITAMTDYDFKETKLV